MNVVSKNGNFSAVRINRLGQHADKRALAGSVRAEQPKEISLFNRKGNVGQSFFLTAALMKGFRKALDTESRRVAGCQIKPPRRSAKRLKRVGQKREEALHPSQAFQLKKMLFPRNAVKPRLTLIGRIHTLLNQIFRTHRSFREHSCQRFREKLRHRDVPELSRDGRNKEIVFLL